MDYQKPCLLQTISRKFTQFGNCYMVFDSAKSSQQTLVIQPTNIFEKIQTKYLKFCSGDCCNFSLKIEVNWVYWKTNKTPEVKVTHFNYKVFPVGKHTKCRSGVSPICKSQSKGQWLLSSTDYNLHFKEQKNAFLKDAVTTAARNKQTKRNTTTGALLLCHILTHKTKELGWVD